MRTEIEKAGGLRVERLRRSYPLLYVEPASGGILLSVAMTVAAACGLLLALAVILGQ